MSAVVVIQGSRGSSVSQLLFMVEAEIKKIYDIVPILVPIIDKELIIIHGSCLTKNYKYVFR
jgi:hypothetical protein